jgi:DNA-binding transcriptional ArsR family regulator
MPYRTLVSQELSKLFSALSHPARIRIIAELRDGELCVNSLQDKLGISHSSVSQHLSLMRAHNLIKERRAGRNVFYRLVSPAMTEWIIDGIQFIVPDQKDSETLKSAIGRAIDTWSHSSDDGDEQREPATGP